MSSTTTGDEVTYKKVAVIERNLSGGRLLVQHRGDGVPTQLSGSAPLIWDLSLIHI